MLQSHGDCMVPQHGSVMLVGGGGQEPGAEGLAETIASARGERGKRAHPPSWFPGPLVSSRASPAGPGHEGALRGDPRRGGEPDPCLREPQEPRVPVWVDT